MFINVGSGIVMDLGLLGIKVDWERVGRMWDLKVWLDWVKVLENF